MEEQLTAIDKIIFSTVDFLCDLPPGEIRTEQQTAILGLPQKLGGTGY